MWSFDASRRRQGSGRVCNPSPILFSNQVTIMGFCFLVRWPICFKINVHWTEEDRGICNFPRKGEQGIRPQVHSGWGAMRRQNTQCECESPSQETRLWVRGEQGWWPDADTGSGVTGWCWVAWCEHMLEGISWQRESLKRKERGRLTDGRGFLQDASSGWTEDEGFAFSLDKGGVQLTQIEQRVQNSGLHIYVCFWNRRWGCPLRVGKRDGEVGILKRAV